MFTTVRNLLEEVGNRISVTVPTYTENFVDDATLEDLDDHGVQEIIPLIGNQMKFKKVLKNWQSQQKKKSSDGRAMLTCGKSSARLLDASHHKRLCQLVIGNLEENPNKVISSQEFKELAADVQQLFLKENEVFSFSPYEGKVKRQKRNPSGKLYESYINHRRKLRKRSELPETSCCSSSSSRSTASASTETAAELNDSESDETGVEKLNWLKNAVEPCSKNIYE